MHSPTSTSAGYSSMPIKTEFFFITAALKLHKSNGYNELAMNALLDLKKIMYVLR